MFAGRIFKYVRDLEFQIACSGPTPASSDISVGGGQYGYTLESAEIYDIVTLVAGLGITVQSFTGSVSGGVTVAGYARVVLNSSALGLSGWTYSLGSSYVQNITAKVVLRNCSWYVNSTPSYVFSCDGADLYVNGTLVQSFGGASGYTSTGLGPGYLPILGIPPQLSGGGGATLYDGSPCSSSTSCTGGYRVKASDGNHYVFPTHCAPLTPPSYGGPLASVSCTDSWSATIEEVAETYPEFGPSHAGWGAASKKAASTSSVWIIPNPGQGINKLGPSYMALIERLDLPGFAEWSNLSGSDESDSDGYGDSDLPTSPWGTVSNSVDWVYPKTNGILAVATGTNGDLEAPLGYTIRCPYQIGSAMTYRQSGPAYEELYVLGSNVQFPYYAQWEPIWPPNYLSWNPGGSAATWSADQVTQVVNYITTWASLGWSYFLFFPPDGLSSTDTNAWLVDGVTQDPDTLGNAYWLSLRDQAMKNSYLPSGSNTGQRAHIVSEPLYTNGLAGFMQAVVAGQITSWWGVSQYQIQPLTVPGSVPLSLDDLWSVSPSGSATLSFGVDGVTVTPTGATTRIICQLWQPEVGLGYFCGYCNKATLAPPTFPTGSGTVSPFWGAYPSLKVPITLSGSSADYVMPQATNPKYMGSWPSNGEDWGIDLGSGDLVSGDYGTDTLSSGDSSTAYADGTYGLVNMLAQPFGQNASYLTLEWDLAALTSGATCKIPYPTLKRNDGNKQIYYDHGQRAFCMYANGGMWRWGVFAYWDPSIPAIVDWPIPQPNQLSPSVLDALGWWQNSNGIAATTGLDTIIRGFYDYDVEFVQDSDLVADAVAGEQLTHAFLLQGRDQSLQMALVNSYSEIPPINSLPLPKRNVNTLVQDPSLGFTGKVDSYCQGVNIVGEPAVGSPSVVQDASGTTLASSSLSACTGWRAYSWKVSPDDGTKSGYKLKYDGHVCATFRPWRGLVWTLGEPGSRPPGLGYDAGLSSRRHCRTTLTSGGHFALGHASNASLTWTDTDSGISASWARPRFVDYGQKGGIRVFYGDGAECWLILTLDEGATYGTALDMGAGVIGDFDEGANGMKWCYKVLSSDGGTTFDVWFQLMDNSLNVIKAWTITNLTGVDQDSIAVRESWLSGARRIGISYSIGGARTFKTSPDGLTFS